MADISIPGVTASKYKTDELIEGLMKLERAPRDRADADLQKYKKQQEAWRQLSRHVSTLRDSVRTLYSYNNPFSEKTAESSNSGAVTATASREAQDQKFSVSVSQVASADSFLSKELPENGTVKKGTYTFFVGDQKLEFEWKGGGYSDFVAALNRRGGDILRASIIRTSPGKRALLIESLKTGSTQRLGFENSALDLALETGLITKNTASAVSTSEPDTTVQPSSSKTIDFSRPVKASQGYVLEYTVSAEKQGQPSEGNPAETIATEPQLQKPGEITYSGITIVNAKSETALTEESAPPPPPPPVETNSVLSLRSTRGAAIPLPDIPAAGEESFTIQLNEFGDVDALLVNNKNTYKTVKLSNIKIYDPATAGDYTPANPVSVAKDAIIKYEGITITRPTNTIDDLVPGVTLSVHETVEKPVSISVAPDTETAKEAVISFVANYNRVMAEINILSQNKPEIITELQYFTQEETEEAEEKLGMMQGDMTLNTLKSALQRITSNPYTADDNSEFKLLSQIGISTRADSGGGLDASRLRGYLEIDENRLDNALENSIQSVKSLFGFDSDGDLVVDSGAAVEMEKNVTPYVQTGGIFSIRTSGLATRITETERKITQMDQQLEAKEASLRQKYSQMEGALNRLESQSESLSNFNRRQNSSN